jgi:hypothetical protein
VRAATHIPVTGTNGLRRRLMRPVVRMGRRVGALRSSRAA